MYPRYYLMTTTVPFTYVGMNGSMLGTIPSFTPILIKHTDYLNVTNQLLISSLQEHLVMCTATFRTPLN